jgi:Cytidylate kinase-like family
MSEVECNVLGWFQADSRQGAHMIKIVTIEREYGSGGGEIAQLLATQLGWKLWDQLLTEEIARLAHCPKAVVEVREERTDPLQILPARKLRRQPKRA